MNWDWLPITIAFLLGGFIGMIGMACLTMLHSDPLEGVPPDFL